MHFAAAVLELSGVRSVACCAQIASAVPRSRSRRGRARIQPTKQGGMCRSKQVCTTSSNRRRDAPRSRIKSGSDH